jgi:hypothetical protein
VTLSAGGTATDGTDATPGLLAAAAAAAAVNPDVSLAGGVLTFTALGSLSFTVTAVDDLDVEDPDETLTASLSGASATTGPAPSISAASATVTIADTDAPQLGQWGRPGQRRHHLLRRLHRRR